METLLYAGADVSAENEVPVAFAGHAGAKAVYSRISNLMYRTADDISTDAASTDATNITKRVSGWEDSREAGEVRKTQGMPGHDQRYWRLYLSLCVCHRETTPLRY